MLRFLFLFLCCVLAAAAARADEAPAAAPRFAVLEYQIEGNTVLQPVAIERAVTPFLGPGRSLADIQAARAALEKTYQDAGYLTVAVDVPEQKIGPDGVVRLRVVEGKVDRLRITGAQHTLASEVRQTASAVREGEVPYFPDLQRQLGALSATPDRQVAPLLRPGAVPGTVEVELAVDDKPALHGTLALNNKQSPQTERGRIEAIAHYDNLFQARHSFGLGYIANPRARDETEVLLANYAAPLGNDGRALALNYLRSNSNLPTSAAGGGLVIGKGDVFGLRYAQPLPARAGVFHMLSLGFDWKNFKETQHLLDTDFDSPIRYLPFQIGYNASLTDGPVQWRWDLSLSFASASILRRDLPEPCDAVALDGTGYNYRLITDQFECKRAGASGSFSVLRGALARSQRFENGWGLDAALDWQYANEPLISNEQFAVGGVDSVRGYLESEASGDRGARLQLQLNTPDLWPFGGAAQWRWGVFFDAAHTELVDALAGEIPTRSLRSAGLATELQLGRDLKFNLSIAEALAPAATTRRHARRMHASLNAAF